MSDPKDDDSSEENEELSKRNQKRRAGEPLIGERDMEIEERARRSKKRLEAGLTPQGVSSGYIPRKEPAPRADFEKWARRDLWHTIEHGPMLILGFEPVDVRAHWWPPSIEDILTNIQENARTSINAGKLPEWSNPRQFLAWAREKEYPIPKELEEPVNRFHSEAKDADRPKWPWGSHETKLLRHLADAANKFWKHYDPSDPATAPTNQEVMDWLKEQGVSKRKADAIATILRADALPTGPRN